MIIECINFNKMFLSTPDFDISKFNLVNIKGEKIEKSMFKDKPLVINYWATWCVPCIEEFPAFVELSKKYEGNINFIFISDEKLTTIQKFCAKKKFDLVFVKTNEDLTLKGLNVRPATYFYESNGKQINSIVGGMKIDELEKQIKSLIE